MIDLHSIIFNSYKKYFKQEYLDIIKKYNIEIFNTPKLALQIYKIQQKIIKMGGHNEKELFILASIQKMYCGCEIYFSTKIGKNFMFVHELGTVIGSNVEIGNDCTVYHNVTIGIQYDTDKNKPKIGNNVIIYAGAKIVGDIKIGNNAVIGANAVVTKNIPDNEVWAGIPVKKININTSNKYKLPIGIL